jgi:hypothetical protein
LFGFRGAFLGGIASKALYCCISAANALANAFLFCKVAAILIPAMHRDLGRGGNRDLGRGGNRDLGRGGNRDLGRGGNRDLGR